MYSERSDYGKKIRVLFRYAVHYLQHQYLSLIHIYTHAQFAGMITRLDYYVGEVLNKLKAVSYTHLVTAFATDGQVKMEI